MNMNKQPKAEFGFDHGFCKIGHLRPLLLIVQEWTWTKPRKANRLLFLFYCNIPFLPTQPRLVQVPPAFSEASGNVPYSGCSYHVSSWVLQQVVEIDDDDDDELDAKTLKLGSPDSIKDFVLNGYLQ